MHLHAGVIGAPAHPVATSVVPPMHVVMLAPAPAAMTPHPRPSHSSPHPCPQCLQPLHPPSQCRLKCMRMTCHLLQSRSAHIAVLNAESSGLHYHLVSLSHSICEKIGPSPGPHLSSQGSNASCHPPIHLAGHATCLLQMHRHAPILCPADCML